MDEKIKLTIRPGIMLPINEDFLYRDSYNQVWKLIRTDNPHIPFTIELYETLNPPISPFEHLIRKSK